VLCTALVLLVVVVVVVVVVLLLWCPGVAPLAASNCPAPHLVLLLLLMRL
jgi:hypothetical protein